LNTPAIAPAHVRAGRRIAAVSRSVALVAAVLLGLHSGAALGQSAAPVGAGEPALKEVPVAAEAFSRGGPVPGWVEPLALPEQTRKRPVVLRLADAQFRVAATPAKFIRRALQSNDPSTLKKIGEFPITFVPDYQHLTIHSIAVLRGGERIDRTQSANIRFLQPTSEFASSVYTSVVTAAVVVDDVRVGDTVEYSYTLEGANPVFEGKYFEFAFWDFDDPVELRRVILSAPEGRRVGWKAVGDLRPPIAEPTVSVKDGIRSLHFEERSIEPITLEPLTPNSYAPFRWIQFSEFESWSDVNGWAGRLFPRPAPTSPEFAALLERVRTAPTPQARLSEALAFTQREIRYFSLSFGESSHRPASPDTVLQRRFGDCKDKSYLLIALLDAVGIEAHPVLLNTSRRGRHELLLPSPSFDHAIVEAKIDGKEYFVDPTLFEQKGRIDRIGQPYERYEVLVVAPGTTALTTIAPAPAELSSVERKDEVVLKRFDGDAELVSRQTMWGMRAGLTRAVLGRVERKMIDKDITGMFEKNYPGAVPNGPVEIQDDPELNQIVLTVRLRIPEFARKSGKGWVVAYRPDNMVGIVNPQVPADRTYPMGVQTFPYSAHYTLDLELPEEVAAIRDPSAEQMNGAFFKYSVKQVFRGNRAKVEIDFSALASEVPANKISEYAADTRKVGQLSHWVVVVTPDDFKKKGFLGIEKSLRQTLAARMRDSIDKYTATIDSGKLGGSDLAEAYCERGSAYNALEEFDKALADGNRAVQLEPNDPAMLSCRSEVYFSSGDFTHAVSDTSHAVLLGEAGARYLRQRGQARFYLKQFADAADDLARSASLEKDAGARPYTDLWAVAAYHRAGKPLPEDIAKRAAEHPRGDWPLPALAMLTGNITPEEMLKVVNRKTGDELAMTQTEAYFYLGQRYLMVGDRTSARDAFDKVRSLGVLPYIEYTSAAFELKELNGTGH